MQYKFCKNSFNKYLKALLFATIAAFLLLTACKHDKKAAVNANIYYTCSMHPQIMETHDGKCPICGMNLIQIEKNNVQKTGEIRLSDQQIQLGNIYADTIGKGVLGDETVLTATLNYDQQKLTAVSSRVMGRVDKLYHKNIGDHLRKGEPLMDVYSEELNNAKQEYLLALERRQVLDNSLIDFDQVIKSAKTKLLLWGMSEDQVKALSKKNKASPTTTVYSNEDGYITSIAVHEGEYVSEGGTIAALADLSTLWAEAQVYTSRFSIFNENESVTVRLPDTGKEIQGKIAFVNPEISTDKRINLVRVTISNKDNQLKPGMPAYVIMKGQKRRTLSLPAGAVIRDGTGSSVWVKTGNNTFKNKMIKVGIESGDRIEVTGGLVQGEAVVTSGAYLINSEYILKKGVSPMAGMKMD